MDYYMCSPDTKVSGQVYRHVGEKFDDFKRALEHPYALGCFPFRRIQADQLDAARKIRAIIIGVDDDGTTRVIP